MVNLTNLSIEVTLLRITKKTAQRLVRKHLEKLIRLIAHVAKKSDKDVERIHHLRTETRRSDAAIRLFQGWLPERHAKRTRMLLNQIRDKAGRIRDLDVQTPFLEALGQQVTEEVQRTLMERAKMLQENGSQSFRRYCKRLLKQDFAEKCKALTQRMHRSQSSSEQCLQEFCCLATSQLATAFNTSIDSLKTDPDQLHRVRIVGRRMRYSLEMMSRLLPEFPTDGICEKLASLQDEIGRVMDRRSLLQFLQAFIAECGHGEFMKSLESAISSFEAETKKRRDAVIQLIIEKAEEIREHAAELSSGRFFGDEVLSE